MAIQYPGRQERRAERPIGDLMMLADRIYDVLHSQPEMPMTSYGTNSAAVGDNDPKARLADARAWVRHTTGALTSGCFPAVTSSWPTGPTRI